MEEYLVNYEKLEENFEVVKTFVLKYKEALIEWQGSIVENAEYCSKEDYAKFMYNLTDEEFVGNQLTALFSQEAIEGYKNILNGELDLDEFLEEYFLFMF